MSFQNMHTHTWRCGHASGDVEDYLAASERQDCQALGFSDHTPLPDGRWSHIRMTLGQLPDYIDRVNNAKASGRIQEVYLGLECEWDPAFAGFYSNEVLPVGDFDYLIGAVHFFPFHGEWLYLEAASTASHLTAYAEQAARTIASGFFSCLAHPDAFLAGYRRWDDNAAACARDIVDTAAACDMVLEINGNGFRKRRQKHLSEADVYYPHNPFWHMAAERGVAVIASTDAHTPEDVADSMDSCLHLAEECGNRVLSASEMVTRKR